MALLLPLLEGAIDVVGIGAGDIAETSLGLESLGFDGAGESLAGAFEGSEGAGAGTSSVGGLVPGAFDSGDIVWGAAPATDPGLESIEPVLEHPPESIEPIETISENPVLEKPEGPVDELKGNPGDDGPGEAVGQAPEEVKSPIQAEPGERDPTPGESASNSGENAEDPAKAGGNADEGIGKSLPADLARETPEQAGARLERFNSAKNMWKQKANGAEGGGTPLREGTGKAASEGSDPLSNEALDRLPNEEVDPPMDEESPPAKVEEPAQPPNEESEASTGEGNGPQPNEGFDQPPNEEPAPPTNEELGSPSKEDTNFPVGGIVDDPISGASDQLDTKLNAAKSDWEGESPRGRVMEPDPSTYDLETTRPQWKGKQNLDALPDPVAEDPIGEDLLDENQFGEGPSFARQEQEEMDEIASRVASLEECANCRAHGEMIERYKVEMYERHPQKYERLWRNDPEGFNNWMRAYIQQGEARKAYLEATKVSLPHPKSLLAGLLTMAAIGTGATVGGVLAHKANAAPGSKRRSIGATDSGHRNNTVPAALGRIAPSHASAGLAMLANGTIDADSRKALGLEPGTTRGLSAVIAAIMPVLPGQRSRIRRGQATDPRVAHPAILLLNDTRLEQDIIDQLRVLHIQTPIDTDVTRPDNWDLSAVGIRSGSDFDDKGIASGCLDFALPETHQTITGCYVTMDPDKADKDEMFGFDLLRNAVYWRNERRHREFVASSKQ